MKRSASTWSNYLKNQNQSKKNLSVTFCWHTFSWKFTKKKKQISGTKNDITIFLKNMYWTLQ